MKKVLSGLVALVLVFSSCVVFAAGSDGKSIPIKVADCGNVWWKYTEPPPAVKGSEKEVIVELSSSGYSWSYTVDNEDMVKLVSQERIPFRGPWGGLMPPPEINRWHFEPLKEGDVTIIFTAPGYFQWWANKFAEGKKISYTYHIDSDLNMELVSEERVTLPSPW